MTSMLEHWMTMNLQMNYDVNVVLPTVLVVAASIRYKNVATDARC